MTTPQPQPPTEASTGAHDGRARLHRVLMILGPLGLALDLVVSLWVSYLHVTRSAVVQMETQWVAGERLAARAALVDTRLGAVEGARAALSLQRGGESWPLGELVPVGVGVAQGLVDVPDLPPGPADLHVELTGPEVEPMIETVSVELVAQRAARPARHTISSSMLQWADDTDPQPEGLRIDLLPFGRILAGFHNEFLIRVTDPAGKPKVGPVEIVLVHGELAGRVGRESAPPVLYQGPTDAFGLAQVDGVLTSDLVRLEVRVLAAGTGTTGPARPVKRRFRLVSYPGGVSVDLRPLAVAPAAELAIEPEALRRSRPIFLDLHAPDGAWIDTLSPPFKPGEEARKWTLPAQIQEGFVQVEAYHYTNDPGEGTALARIHVSRTDPADPASLAPLVARQRERLDVPRLDPGFDAAHERRYLDHVAAARPGPTELETVRRWLIGSLPVEIYGPPTALTTLHRDEEAVRARRASWFVALRVFLWGGGALFLVILGVSLRRAEYETAQRMTAALAPEPDAGDVGSALMLDRGAVLFRGAIVIAIVATGLTLIALMMESFIWIP